MVFRASDGIRPERIHTKKELDVVESLVEDFCSRCPGHEDESMGTCGCCAMRRFSEFITPKVLLFHGGGRMMVEEGTWLRFSYQDGTVLVYRIHVIDMTHLELLKDDQVEGYGLILHHMQLESIIADARGMVETRDDDGEWLPLDEAMARAC